MCDIFSEAEIASDKEAYEQVKKQAAAWKEKWPNHCKYCGGWGGGSFQQSHPYGSGSAQEQMFDPCQAIEKPETCHRCGQDGLDEDGNGPCTHCGWNYDDGEPQW